MACHYYVLCICLINEVISKNKGEISLFNFPFCKLFIFHTPHFPHSTFSALRIFHTPRFPHSAFSTLCTPHFPLNRRTRWTTRLSTQQLGTTNHTFGFILTYTIKNGFTLMDKKERLTTNQLKYTFN